MQLYPLSLSLSQLLRTMKGQFAGLLYDTGFVHSSDPKNPASNVNSGNIKLVKAVLCSGMYPNVIKVEQKKPGRLAAQVCVYWRSVCTRGMCVLGYPWLISCTVTFVTLTL